MTEKRKNISITVDKNPQNKIIATLVSFARNNEKTPGNR